MVIFTDLFKGKVTVVLYIQQHTEFNIHNLIVYNLHRIIHYS